ncbi:MAG: hypothetical protein O7D91_04600 [Planctomycetota bacterium]|nr:hypothetical protein [Planctomycetota bacterium]
MPICSRDENRVDALSGVVQVADVFLSGCMVSVLVVGCIMIMFEVRAHFSVVLLVSMLAVMAVVLVVTVVGEGLDQVPRRVFQFKIPVDRCGVFVFLVDVVDRVIVVPRGK